MQLVLGIVGTVFGGPIGGMVGSLVGGFLDRALFAPDPTVSEGPRLEDLHVQVSSYGVAIPRVWGNVRIAGNLMWAAPIAEVRTEEEIGGGGGCLDSGPTAIQVTYSYYGTCAVLVCAGPITGISRIWADTKLIYDSTGANASLVQIPGLDFTVYLGDETQTADPTMTAYEGAGNVPGHRGTAYVVFRNLPLEHFGNRIPNFSFEVNTNSVVDYQTAAIASGVAHGVYPKLTPDGAFLIDVADYTWTKTRIFDGAVVLQVTHGLDQDMTVPYPTTDFDIDEQGSIYACGYDGADTYLVRMNQNFEIEAQSAASYYVTGLKVNKRPGRPYLYGIIANEADQPLAAFMRDTLVKINQVDFPALDCKYIAVQTSTGDAFAVFSGSGTTKIARFAGGAKSWDADISTVIYNGAYITYDPASNALIVGTREQQATLTALVAYDASSLDLLGSLTGNYVGDYSNASFDRGVVTGYFYLTYTLAGTNTIRKIKVPDMTVAQTWTVTPTGLLGTVYEPMTNSVWAVPASGTGLSKIMFDRSTLAAVNLDDVVSDICSPVDLAAEDIDVSALTADEIEGYVLNRQMAARAALQPLMDAWFLDAVETGGQIKFVKRGGSSAVTIPEVDLGAHSPGSERPDLLAITRKEDTSIPNEIAVKYMDLAANYRIGTQRAKRQVTQARDVKTIDLPIVMSADRARQIAEIALGYLWMGRNAVEFPLSNEYVWLDPADVVTVEKGTASHRLRIDRTSYQDGLVKVSALMDGASIYTSTATGEPLPVYDPSIPYPGPTLLWLLDIPALSDSQTAVGGIYLAGAGYLSSWKGAAVAKSSDDGATWSAWAAVTKDGALGFCTTVLGDTDHPWLWDDGSTVNVRLIDDDFALASTTQAAVLNGANRALVGSEIIGFTTATAEADGTYTLSGLLRGCRGTDQFCTGHAGGERFVLLGTAYLHFQDAPLSERAVERLYQYVSMGLAFSSGIQASLTLAFANLKPYSPVDVRGVRDGSNNLTVTWKRRTRIGGEWLDGADVPLGETSESYEVDVYDGATVVRTITGLSSATAGYSAAQQTTDGLTPGDPVDLSVYQLSAAVGRGFGRSATV